MKTLLLTALALLVMHLRVSLLQAAEISLTRAAHIAAGEHRFAEAQQLLQTHLQANPRDGAAWLQLASVATVRADADGASTACARAASYVDPVATLACRGRVALVTQQYAPAYTALQTLLQHPRYSAEDDVWTSWARGVAAELAVKLRLESEADALFERALAAHPSRQLWAARLDHLLATQRQLQVLSSVAASEPDAVLQLRRLIALRQLGRQGEAADQLKYYDWQFQSDLAQGNLLHAREIARFYLDVHPHPARALQAAEKNLDSQREAEDYALYQRALLLQAGVPIKKRIKM